MKTLLLFGLMMLPAICFSQAVDTVAVIKQVDSLIQISRGLTSKRDFEKALEVNAAAEKLAFEKLGKETASYGNACSNHGRVFDIQGNYPEAEKWYLETKAIREKVFGKEHPDYAHCLSNLAALYTDMGRYEAAEPLCLETLAIQEKVLGKDNIDYANSLNNLAILYSGMGRYDALESLFLEVKAIREKVLGKEHPEYAMSLNNLANLYSNMGRSEDAELLYLEANAIREKVLGKEHPDYIGTLNNLAVLYFDMGRYEAAEPLYLEALAIRGKVLGKEHPDYATSLHNLALLYSDMGRYEAAEPLFLEALAIQEKVLGKEHPEYANSLINLASLYTEMGRYEAAEPLSLEVLAIRGKVLGKEHPDYARSLYNLALLYSEMGRYEAAKELYIESTAIREKILGKEHPEYANSLSSMAAFYSYMGLYEAAEPLFLEANAILEKALGKEHPDYAWSLNNLANLYFQMGRFETAEPLFLEANAILEKTLGKEHPDYASSLDNLANLYSEIGRYDAAEPLYLEAKAIREKVLGKEHPDYASSLINLANLYSNTGRNEAAESFYLEAKAIIEKALGKEHPKYADNLSLLAGLYTEMGRYEAAEPLYLEAKATREKVLGKEHPDYARSLNNLAVLYHEMRRYEAAEPLFLETKTILEKVFGKEDPEYAICLNNLADLYSAMSHYEVAEPLYLEANAIQRQLITKSCQYLSERELSSYVQLFVRNLDKYFSFAQTSAAPSLELSGGCYDNALFHKGFLLTASQQLKHLAESDSSSAKQFEVLTAYHRRLAKEYTKPIAERKSVEQLEEKANTLEKALARSVPGFAAALRQVSWQEVQKKLKPGEAAVEFIQYQFSNPRPSDSIFYSVLVLRPGDKAPVLVPLFEERDIRPLLENAKGGNVTGINALYAPGGQKSLYDLIWKPLEKSLQGVSTVYCSPSGLLHRINLGAIPTDKQQTFSELHKLVLLGSTRQLVVPNVFKVAGNSAYVAGGIRYDLDSTNFAYEHTEVTSRGIELSFSLDSTARGGSWKYLPGSATEAIEIGKILKGQKFAVQLDTGYAATEEAFKRLGNSRPSPRTILLATHGFFFPDPQKAPSPGRGLGEAEPVFKTSDDPLIRSGIILAGAQQTWSTGKGKENREDGILTAYEISQMDLSGTELVVLSACETGLGDIVGNEGVYGLQRAFKIAGAKYLIMSLWKVNDRSTGEFMTEFYRQWLEMGLSIPDAFRTAQQNMKIKYKDPYHWAGFVLVE